MDLHKCVVAACYFGAAAMLSGCADVLVSERPAASSSAETTLRLAERMRDGGDPSGARALFRQVLLSEPSSLTALLSLARIDYRAGDYAHAEGAYREALAIAPDNVDAGLGLARTLVAAGQAAASLDALRRLAEPADVRVRADIDLVRGVALDMQGQHQAAQRVYQRALKMTPRDIRLRSNHALSQALSGNTAAAVATLHAIAKHPLADARHQRNYAMALAVAGDEAAAFAAARAVLNEIMAHRLVEIGRQIRETPSSERGPDHRLGVLTAAAQTPARTPTTPPNGA